MTPTPASTPLLADVRLLIDAARHCVPPCPSLRAKRGNRNQLKQVFDALRELMTPPNPPKPPIGFVPPEERGNPSL